MHRLPGVLVDLRRFFSRWRTADQKATEFEGSEEQTAVSISRVSLLNMARASRKNRPGYATKGSRVRRNAKREAARGAAGEWEGAADE